MVHQCKAQTCTMMSGEALGAAETGGAAQYYSSGRSRRWRCHHHNEAQQETPKKWTDPCKVFVSNLPKTVTEHTLHQLLSYSARVKKVTVKRCRQSKESKGCAIVKVRSIRDMQKLLVLREWDRDIQGQIFTIRGARSSVTVPGDHGERDFDLASPDPQQPSIHMLVDDIMLKVFSYLPLQRVLTCEGVCRRWQMLIHKYFSRKTSLELTEPLHVHVRTQNVPCPRTENVIPKLLVLSGPNLRSLKIHKVRFEERRNILQIIGHLCPQLEYLDISKSREIDFTYVDALAEGCENMKGFVATDCWGFRQSILHRVLKLFPQLEKLDVMGTMTRCKDYSFLPSTLKELHIESYADRRTDEMTIQMVANRCPNLEALTLSVFESSAASLMYLSNTCHKLTSLSVQLDICNYNDYTEALSTFKQLKELALYEGTIDLNLLFTGLSQTLEVLTLRSLYEGRHADFSILEKLKSLTVNNTRLTKESLKTVDKCREIERIHITSSSAELVVAFLQGCPKLKELLVPGLHELSRSHITEIDWLMKGRPGKVVIKTSDKDCLAEFTEYDRDKIQFGYTPFWLGKSDSEHSSSEFDSDDDYF